jgi:hypothetical protein
VTKKRPKQNKPIPLTLELSKKIVNKAKEKSSLREYFSLQEYRDVPVDWLSLAAATPDCLQGSPASSGVEITNIDEGPGNIIFHVSISGEKPYKEFEIRKQSEDMSKILIRDTLVINEYPKAVKIVFDKTFDRVLKEFFGRILKSGILTTDYYPNKHINIGMESDIEKRGKSRTRKVAKYAPKRNMDFERHKNIWRKIQSESESGINIANLLKKIKIDPKYISFKKISYDTLRRVMRAGQNGEFNDEVS